MLLDLSCVLSEQHTMIQQDVPVEMEDFVLGGEHFPILRKSPLSITVEYVEERKLQITGKAEFLFSIPCDRCLTPVETPLMVEPLRNKRILFISKTNLQISKKQRKAMKNQEKCVEHYFEFT